MAKPLNTLGLINSHEAAKLCHKAEITMRWWRSKGIGPRYYKVGRSVLYDPEDVRRWVEENAVQASGVERGEK